LPEPNDPINKIMEMYKNDSIHCFVRNFSLVLKDHTKIIQEIATINDTNVHTYDCCTLINERALLRQGWKSIKNISKITDHLNTITAKNAIFYGHYDDFEDGDLIFNFGKEKIKYYLEML